MVSLTDERGKIESEGNESVSPVWYALLFQWLAARHQRRQEQIADSLRERIKSSFSVFDPHDLDRNSIEWTRTAVDAIHRAFEDSQIASDAFIREVRVLDAPDAPPLPGHLLASEAVREGARTLSPHRDYLVGPGREVLPPFDEYNAGLRMLSAGPAYVKSQMPAPVGDAMSKAADNAAGRAVEIALDGGRNLAYDTAARDRVAIGWRRVTDTNPCSFCAMLASRGTVFKEGSYAASDARFDPPENLRQLTEGELPAKVHNNCRCSLVPVFTREERFSDEALAWRALWNKSTKGLRGNAALNAFRRAYEHDLFGKQNLYEISEAELRGLLSRIDQELLTRFRRGQQATPSSLFLRDQQEVLRAQLGLS